jgi:hypothetical protein
MEMRIYNENTMCKIGDHPEFSSNYTKVII